MCGNLKAVYDSDARLVRLQDKTTDELIRTLGSNLNKTLVGGFSPNCQMLATWTSIVSNEALPYDTAPLDDHYRDRSSGTLTLWDVTTGARLYEFDDPYQAESPTWVNWSPDSTWAFIKVSEGYFFWNAASNQSVMLQYMLSTGGVNVWRDAINTEADIYWDMQRGELLVTGWNAVHAFDIQTGVERHRFGYCDSFWGCTDLCVSDDNTVLMVINDDYSGSRWNLDTLEQIPGRVSRRGFSCSTWLWWN